MVCMQCMCMCVQICICKSSTILTNLLLFFLVIIQNCKLLLLFFFFGIFLTQRGAVISVFRPLPFIYLLIFKTQPQNCPKMCFRNREINAVDFGSVASLWNQSVGWYRTDRFGPIEVKIQFFYFTFVFRFFLSIVI